MIAANATASGCGISEKTFMSRRDYVFNLLDMRAWGQMSAQVAEFKPDFVISAARKMPRLVQLLQSMLGGMFHSPAQYVSDFALDFLQKDIKGARVAILDDALNVGSTLNDVLHRAQACNPAEAMCFVLSRRTGGGAGFKQAEKLQCMQTQDIDEHAYRAAATRVVRALWALNRPLEVEFPVFTGQGAPVTSVKELQERVNAIGGRCHALNIAESPFLGLQRYSVEMDPASGFNDKIRLYVDIARQELALAPMAYSWDRNVGRQTRIKKRFLASMRLARDFIGAVFPDLDMRFAEEEAAILLGPQEAAKMGRIWHSGELGQSESKSISNSFCENDWPRIKRLCQIEDNRFLHECFTAFFAAAAKYYEAESANDYDRLCKGPTFVELRKALAELWEMDPAQKSDVLIERLGTLLDEQIDNGFVVPMTDKEGRRVFRKGEPYPYYRNALEVLRFIYGEFDPSENIVKEMAELAPEDRERFDRIMLALEAPQICRS